MTPGIWQILLVLVLVLVLFGGRGKISAIMGDLAKGITSFRKGLKDEDEPKALRDEGETIDVSPEKTKAES
ncbi:MAG: twin-arginine translocase TatA/TatE family subunit [Caulobacterales bacterium]|nr:twin-arginine translocase TatA/TatE family subunit [Caulobacterales bacterium]